jgi:hypothetical protein
LRRISVLLLVLAGGCSFDSAALDARRCAADDECEPFGPGYACTDGYCVAQGESCNSDDDCGAELGACTTDACIGGHCAPVPSPAGTACPAVAACVDAQCDGEGACLAMARDERCSNGLACDGAELCIPDLSADASGCVNGDEPDVEDGIECTVGRCDDVLGGVVQDATACECDTPGEVCGNVSAPACFQARCTADYTCSVIALSAGDPCDDGAPCTTADVCDNAQNCTGSPDHTRCDDDRFCNGVEVCAPGDQGVDANGCRAGAPVDVSDGIDCTIDSCDEATDEILHGRIECACETDSDCTATCHIGRCTGGICDFILAAPGVFCDDETDCTTDDVCDANGGCAGRERHTQCSDGLFCNGAEMCVPGDPGALPNGCVASPPPVVDDGVACTVDSCDEGNDAIINQPGEDCPCSEDDDCASPCNDGLCVDFRCEVTPHDNGTSCDDGLGCTDDDECDNRGNCVGDPDDERCDNGTYCDGEERCEPEAPDRGADGCIDGDRPVDLHERERECEVITCDEEEQEVVVNTDACCDPEQEGPRGDDSCADDVDNDCDGLIDSADLDCSFEPDQLGGLKLWLDADGDPAVNFRLTGRGDDDVNDWFDKSGNSNHASQSGMERPKLMEVDGHMRVQLNGRRWLVVANEGNFDFVREVTVIVAFSVERFDENWQALVTKGDGTWRVHRLGNSSEIGFGYNNFWGAHDIGGGNPTGGGLHQVMARWDDGDADLWLDGTLVGDRDHIDPNLRNNNHAVWIGNNAEATDRQWKGDVVEVIVYDRALNETERGLVFEYLRAKWSLP